MNTKTSLVTVTILLMASAPVVADEARDITVNIEPGDDLTVVHGDEGDIIAVAGPVSEEELLEFMAELGGDQELSSHICSTANCLLASCSICCYDGLYGACSCSLLKCSCSCRAAREALRVIEAGDIAIEGGDHTHA